MHIKMVPQKMHFKTSVTKKVFTDKHNCKEFFYKNELCQIFDKKKNKKKK